MPTITLHQALAAREGLAALIQMPLPVKTAWGLTRLARAFNAAVTDYEETRNGLIQRFGTPDPRQPGYYQFQGEGLEEWNRQHAELLDQAIDLPEVKVRLEDLGTIAPATLLAVEWLIEDGAPEPLPAGGAP